MLSEPYNIVLSGGGSRGYAHVGVLEALMEQGLEINAVSATSAGGLIGALLCDGFHPAEIKEMVLAREPKVSFNLKMFKSGLLSLTAINEFLKKNLRSKQFNELKKPLYIGVTNLITGKHEIINEGLLIDALMAASAIPVLFAAVNVNQIPCGDGGITNNLPVEPFLNDPHKLIGIHVNPLSKYSPSNSVAELTDRSIHMAIRPLIESNSKHCHLFIEPPDLAKFHLFETGKTSQIMQTGYDYVKKNIKLNS